MEKCGSLKLAEHLPTVQSSNSTTDNKDLQEDHEGAINVLLGAPQQQESLEETSDLKEGESREHPTENNEIEGSPSTENEDNEIEGSSNVQDENIISESSGQTDQMS